MAARHIGVGDGVAGSEIEDFLSGPKVRDGEGVRAGAGQPDSGRRQRAVIARPARESQDVPGLVAGNDRAVVQVLRLPRADDLRSLRRVALADFLPGVYAPVPTTGLHDAELAG